jgi:hypothetical protein
MEIRDLQNTLTASEKGLIRKISKIEQFELIMELKGGFSGAKVIWGVGYL